MKRLSCFAILCLALLQLAEPARAEYDRCDDLCRVLGHTGGGACEGTAKPRCICYPDHIDVEEFLPSICETEAKEPSLKEE